MRILIKERRKATCGECYYHVDGDCCFDRESKPVESTYVCKEFSSIKKDILYHFNLDRQDRLMKTQDYKVSCSNCIIECKNSESQFCREFRPEPIPGATWTR